MLANWLTKVHPVSYTKGYDMPEFTHLQVEATLRFEDALDIVDVEEAALEECKRYCETEIGWIMWPYSCEAQSSGDESTNEITLRCESLSCVPMNETNHHPILFALNSLTKQIGH